MSYQRSHDIQFFLAGSIFLVRWSMTNNSVSNHRALAINTENDIYKNIKLALKRRHFLTFVSKSWMADYSDFKSCLEICGKIRNKICKIFASLLQLDESQPWMCSQLPSHKEQNRNWPKIQREGFRRRKKRKKSGLLPTPTPQRSFSTQKFFSNLWAFQI